MHIWQVIILPEWEIIWTRRSARRRKCRKSRLLQAADRKISKTDELPFDYNRRFSSVLLNTGEENIWIIKGSIEEVMRQCSMIEYRGEKTAAGADILQNVHAVVDEMLEDG